MHSQPRPMAFPPYSTSYLAGPISWRHHKCHYQKPGFDRSLYEYSCSIQQAVINIPRKGKEYLSSFNELGGRSICRL